MTKEIRNIAKCSACGDIIESTYRHDFQTCKCDKSFVDGGHDYCRWGGSAVAVTPEEIEEYDKKKK